MKIKMRLMYAVVLALVTFAFVGCSKDKDEPIQTGGSIDAAVGTYKGSLDLSNTSGPMFDKTLTVTKISDNTLKVEIGDKALKIPAKEFKVINNMNIAIQTAGVSPEGSFLFDVEKRHFFAKERKLLKMRSFSLLKERNNKFFLSYSKKSGIDFNQYRFFVVYPIG